MTNSRHSHAFDLCHIIALVIASSLPQLDREDREFLFLRRDAGRELGAFAERCEGV